MTDLLFKVFWIIFGFYFLIFYKAYLKDDFAKYPFWIAHYGQLYRPRIDNKWHFWQYSCEGNVNGIKANVDFNVFNGSKADLEALCKK